MKLNRSVNALVVATLASVAGVGILTATAANAAQRHQTIAPSVQIAKAPPPPRPPITEQGERRPERPQPERPQPERPQPERPQPERPQPERSPHDHRDRLPFRN